MSLSPSYMAMWKLYVREGVLLYNQSGVEMANTYQKVIALFQTLYDTPRNKEKKITDCIQHKQVDISNCVSVFFLWIIIELCERIHKDGFVSSLGDKQVFVSVGLCMKDGQIS